MTKWEATMLKIRARKGWYRQRDDSWCEMYQSGLSIPEIADRTMYDYETIREVLKARGVLPVRIYKGAMKREMEKMVTREDWE